MLARAGNRIAPNPPVEWKDRDAIIRNAWYVRADDPALNP